MGFEIGKTVAGYEIVEVLGTSKTGVAYKVRNVFAQRFEVLKILPKSIQDDEEQNARFLREIKLHAQLLHPNIVTFYNARDIDGQLVMTMEFVPGVTLAEKLKAGPLAWREASRYAEHALAALEYAHAHGIIHRGFSSQNLMITDEGIARLTGFGFAKSVSDPELTAAGVVIGALKYMSPEQVKGDGVDVRSDIYSLGIVLYEMLVGKVPFDAKGQFEIMMAQVSAAPKHVSGLNPEVPRELGDLVAKALAKSADGRFQTAREFRDAIEQFAAAHNAPAVESMPESPVVTELIQSASEPEPPASVISEAPPAPHADAWALDSALELAEPKLTNVDSEPAQPEHSSTPILETLANVSVEDESNTESEPTPKPVVVAPAASTPIFPAVDWWTSRSTFAAAPRAQKSEPRVEVPQPAVEHLSPVLEPAAVASDGLPDVQAIESAVISAQPAANREAEAPIPVSAVHEAAVHEVAEGSQLPAATDWWTLNAPPASADAEPVQPEFALTPTEPEAHTPVVTTLEAAEVPAITVADEQPDLWSGWAKPNDSKLESTQLDLLSAALQPVQASVIDMNVEPPPAPALTSCPDLWAAQPVQDAVESKQGPVEVRLSQDDREKHDLSAEEPLSLWTSGPPDTWVSEPAAPAHETTSQAADLSSLSVAVEPPPATIESAELVDTSVAPPSLPAEASAVEIQPQAAQIPPEPVVQEPPVSPVASVPTPIARPVNPDLLTALFGDTLLSRVSLTLVVCAITFFLGTVTLFAVLSVSKP